MSTRILLADDHALFAQSVGHLLGQRYEVVDIVGDGKALHASAMAHKPDIIVTDITMPHMSGLDGIRLVRTNAYAPKVVFLTMHCDTQLARECFNSGASAFVTKDSGFDELLVAIDAVVQDKQYVSPKIAAELFENSSEDAAPAGTSDLLTTRQREILQLFAEGKTMKEIASITNLSTRTVEWHKYRMMQMLKIHRSAELVKQ